MADTFNPIVEEGNVPTDEVGVLGTRKVRPKNPEFKPVPKTAVVIHRPRSNAVGVNEDDFEVLGEHQSVSAVRMDASSRFFRIDLGERVIEWEDTVPSQDADESFAVKLVTVVAVSDAKRIAVLGVRDARAHLRPAVRETIRHAAASFPVDAASVVADDIANRLKKATFDCGIEVRAAFAIVGPDARAAKRLEQDHDNRLKQQVYEFGQEIRRRAQERELALQKQSDEFEIKRKQAARDAQAKLEQAESDFELQLRQLQEPRQQELANLQAQMELEKVEQQAKLDAKREEYRKARQEAEEKSQEQQRKHEEELARSQAEHEAKLAEIQAAHEARLAEIKRDTENARESAQAESARLRHEQELKEAADLNAQIARDPSKMMGLLLALGDTDSVRSAFKMVEERQKVAWERFRDLQKLGVLPEEELQGLAISLMRDPAGGAFGLGAESEAGAAAD